MTGEYTVGSIVNLGKVADVFAKEYKNFTSCCRNDVGWQCPKCQRVISPLVTDCVQCNEIKDK
jgi:uncharacterized OB-fold protein